LIALAGYFVTNKSKLPQVKTGEIQAQQAKKEKIRLMVAADGIAFADMLMYRYITS
jgi:hypothetical protein